jgi:hypothetical protein
MPLSWLALNTLIIQVMIFQQNAENLRRITERRLMFGIDPHQNQRLTVLKSMISNGKLKEAFSDECRGCRHNPIGFPFSSFSFH